MRTITATATATIKKHITSVQPQNLSISWVIESVHAMFSINQLVCTSVQPKQCINQFCGYISSGPKLLASSLFT